LHMKKKILMNLLDIDTKIRVNNIIQDLELKLQTQHECDEMYSLK
jgi:hypothetical protein